MEKTLKMWSNWLGNLMDSLNDQNIHSDIVKKVYESYHTLDSIYKLESIEKIEENIRIYQRFLSIVNEIRVKTAYRPYSDKGRERRKERIDEIISSLKDDISTLKTQRLALRQEIIMNEQMVRIDKQIEQIEKQMKVSRYTFGVAVISLVMSVIFSVLTFLINLMNV